MLHTYLSISKKVFPLTHNFQLIRLKHIFGTLEYSGQLDVFCFYLTLSKYSRPTLLLRRTIWLFQNGGLQGGIFVQPCSFIPVYSSIRDFRLLMPVEIGQKLFLQMFCVEMKGPTQKSLIFLTELQFDVQTELNQISQIEQSKSSMIFFSKSATVHHW